MKKIVKLTYNNMMLVIKEIEKKGYNFDEAFFVAQRFFETHENNPNGQSINSMVDRVMPKQEFIKEYNLNAKYS